VLDVPGGAMADLLRFIDGASHLLDEMKLAGRDVEEKTRNGIFSTLRTAAKLAHWKS
jgi:hypothetical protein